MRAPTTQAAAMLASADRIDRRARRQLELVGLLLDAHDPDRQRESRALYWHKRWIRNLDAADALRREAGEYIDDGPHWCDRCDTPLGRYPLPIEETPVCDDCERRDS